MTFAIIIRQSYYEGTINAPQDALLREGGYEDTPIRVFPTAEAAQERADAWNARMALGEYWLSYGEYGRPHAEVISTADRSAGREIAKQAA